MKGMKKLLAVLLLASLVSPLAEANPFKTVKNKVEHFAENHPGFTAAAVTLVVTSIYSFKASQFCDAPGYDPEACNIRYGSRYKFDTGVTILGVGALFAGEKCKKDQPGWKFCNAIQFAIPAAQVAAGTHDYLNRKPEKD